MYNKHNYVKDEKSGAILNINIKEFEDLKNKRKQEKLLRDYDNRLAQLEKHVSEMSNSVNTILEKLSGLFRQ